MRSATAAAYRLARAEHSGGTLTATVDFDPGAPIFAGHYPELAVVPGVLLIDIACLLATELAGGARWQIHSAQFSSPVHPGTPVTLTVDTQADGEVRIAVSSGGRKTASIRLRPDDSEPLETREVAQHPSGEPVVSRLPHRPPMAFLDEAITVGDGRLTAHCHRESIEFHRYSTTFSSPDPAAIWPATLMLEAWCQAAAVLMMTLEPEFTTPAVLISRLATVRTRAEVEMGETLELSVRLLERFPDASTFTGYARAGQRTVLDIDRLTATLRPFDQLRSSS
ncbi:hypothetical protein [Nocardia sp. NPDC056100]|uniref:hypothetical protein n=1 Tax=Nocardia sp. NPDC056100 TaxID=3345712 RepID=UPI0035E21862